MSNKTDVRLSEYLSKRRNLPVRLAKSDRVLVETKDSGRKVWISKETLDKAKDQYKVVKEKGKELAKKGLEKGKAVSKAVSERIKDVEKEGLGKATKIAFSDAKKHLTGKTGPAIKKALTNFKDQTKLLGQEAKIGAKFLKSTYARELKLGGGSKTHAIKEVAKDAKKYILPMLKKALKGVTSTPVGKAIGVAIAATAAIFLAKKLLKKKAPAAKVEGSVSQMLLLAYADDGLDMEKHFKESVEEAIQMALDDKLPDNLKDLMKEE